MFVRRRVAPAVLVALAPLLASLLISAPASAEPDLTLTGHRGSPTRALGENTLPAFGRALADGATAIEADLRRTKDDKLVVLHDSGVGRTTTCSGPIGSWTLRDLVRKCRENTTKQPLLTARELLVWAERTGASLMLELKGSNWSIDQVRGVVELLKDSPVLDKVAISSLRLTVLQRVHRLAPKVDTHLVVSGWRKVRSSIGDVSGYNVPAASLTTSRVRRLQRKGIVVVGGYADSPAQWRTLATLGVDGVVTPSVRKYQLWAGARS